MYFEVHKDDCPQAVGSHEGSDGAALLYVKDANFNRYITLGVACHNTTQDTDGLVVAATQDTLTVTKTVGNDVSEIMWDNGDEYEIYITDTKDSFISKIAIDKIYGRKI